MNMTEISNPHDKFFKAIFTQKEATKEFVKTFLPEALASHIDLETLTLEQTEYVDKKLKQHVSDIVYACQYKSNDTAIEVKISLLFEHKSYPEKYPHLQLLRYLLGAWEAQSKQKQTLTPIVPIIFYHGKSSWNKRSLTSYFTQVDKVLANYIPNFDYVLLDTSEHDNTQFSALNNKSLWSGILLMKNIFYPDDLERDFTTIFTSTSIDELLQTEEGRNFFDTFIVYLASNLDLNTTIWEEKMNTLSTQAKEQFISTAMRWQMQGEERGIKMGLERGLERGLEKGRKEGITAGKIEIANSMLREGMPDSTILKLTGLTQGQLARLKNKG